PGNYALSLPDALPILPGATWKAVSADQAPDRAGLRHPAPDSYPARRAEGVGPVDLVLALRWPKSGRYPELRARRQQRSFPWPARDRKSTRLNSSHVSI